MSQTHRTTDSTQGHETNWREDLKTTIKPVGKLEKLPDPAEGSMGA